MCHFSSHVSHVICVIWFTVHPTESVEVTWACCYLSEAISYQQICQQVTCLIQTIFSFLCLTSVHCNLHTPHFPKWTKTGQTEADWCPTIHEPKASWHEFLISLMNAHNLLMLFQRKGLPSCPKATASLSSLTVVRQRLRYSGVIYRVSSVRCLKTAEVCFCFKCLYSLVSYLRLPCFLTPELILWASRAHFPHDTQQ